VYTENTHTHYPQGSPILARAAQTADGDLKCEPSVFQLALVLGPGAIPWVHCSCNICKRQPPSLFALSAWVVFNYVFNAEHFELTVDTTYDQYVYAVRTNRVSTLKLLPLEYPFIRVFILFGRLPQKHHYHCPGRLSWNGEYQHKFESHEEAISELVNSKDVFWCEFCEKPLFFPPSCKEHL
jgi:hypothetical protein